MKVRLVGGGGGDGMGGLWGVGMGGLGLEVGMGWEGCRSEDEMKGLWGWR